MDPDAVTVVPDDQATVVRSAKNLADERGKFPKPDDSE
jgi:hypothetical protein